MDFESTCNFSVFDLSKAHKKIQTQRGKVIIMGMIVDWIGYCGNNCKM